MVVKVTQLRSTDAEEELSDVACLKAARRQTESRAAAAKAAEEAATAKAAEEAAAQKAAEEAAAADGTREATTASARIKQGQCIFTTLREYSLRVCHYY